MNLIKNSLAALLVAVFSFGAIQSAVAGEASKATLTAIKDALKIEGFIAGDSLREVGKVEAQDSSRSRLVFRDQVIPTVNRAVYSVQVTDGSKNLTALVSVENYSIKTVEDHLLVLGIKTFASEPTARDILDLLNH